MVDNTLRKWLKIEFTTITDFEGTFSHIDNMAGQCTYQRSSQVPAHEIAGTVGRALIAG